MSGNIALNTLTSIYNNSFTEYLKNSETIGGVIAEQSTYVDRVFKTTLELVENFGKYKKPSNPVVEQYITDPLLDDTAKIVAFDTKASDHIFQITLISKSIKIFEWVKEKDPEKFINNLQKYVQFYQQKTQCEIEELGRIHFDWLNHWNETYEEFSMFVINFFKNGIHWSGSLPLIVSPVLGDSRIVGNIEPHRISLSDMCQGRESFKTFCKQDLKWLIQNQRNRHNNLVLNTARRDESVDIFNCEDSTIVLENAVDIIHVERCKRVTVLFRNASKLETKDCKECNVHCFERVSALDMTMSENCGIYLSDKSLGCMITTTQSIGIYVNFPFEDGLYQSFKIEEKLTTKILPNKGIETTVGE